MRKFTMAATAATLSIAAVSVMGAGIAAAKGPGGHGPHSGVATGSTTCNVHGQFSAAAGSTVSLSGNITPKHGKACSSTGGTRLKVGHLKGRSLASTATTAGVCTLLPGGSLPDLGGGTIWWSPRGHVAASTGVAFTGGAASVVTVGSDTFLQIAYTGGSVAGGSFTNASGGSLTVTSNEDIAALTAACAAGPVTSISYRGSLTL